MAADEQATVLIIDSDNVRRGMLACSLPTTRYVLRFAKTAEVGLDLLARSAPSLDPPRSRAALRAMEFLTGRTFGADPVRALAWWESAGRRMAPDELLAEAGLAPDDDGGVLRAGAGP